MIRSPAGFDGCDRIKRYLDYYQSSYGVMMLSAGQFSPLSLFATGEQGAWYNPSNIATLFQDAFGVTPVTAVDEFVGLMLDNSQKLVLGPEVVTNGTFSTDSDWVKGAGWTISGGSANYDGTNAPNALYQTAAVLASGKFYRVLLTVVLTQGALLVRPSYVTTAGQYQITSSGTYSILLSGQGSSFGLLAGNSGGRFIGSVDNVSVCELFGNHASQSVSGARPALRATNRIDYDGSDDKMTAVASGGGTTGFLFVAGINLDVINAAQTIWSDTGTNTGYRVRINSSNQLELAAGNGTSYTTAVTTETLSATTNYVVSAWHDGTNLNVQLGTGGAIASQAFATASAGSAGFTMGMDNGVVSSQLNGKVYNAIYVKNFAGSLTDVKNTIGYVNGTLA